LGAERSKRESRPKPKLVLERLPLDESAALFILDSADSVFLSLVPGLSKEELNQRIQRVNTLVRKSFERSAGLAFNETSPSTITAFEFNFLSYVYFKAFSDILVEKKVNFGPFRMALENKLGDKIVKIISTAPSKERDPDNAVINSTSSTLRKKMTLALENVDRLMQDFRNKGLIAVSERSQISEEQVADWSEDLSDLQFSLAIDGDCTMNAQVLLQEQGIRLYPDYVRLAVASCIRNTLSGLPLTVTSDEYYLDTDYNSDPDKFEAKQVLLNIVIGTGM